MQDIVFYAAANETLGVVRDYANARKAPAPMKEPFQMSLRSFCKNGPPS